MKLLIDNFYALYYADLKKPHRFVYILSSRSNIGHCVELAFLEGKLGRFLMLAFLKEDFLKTHCIVKVKEDST